MSTSRNRLANPTFQYLDAGMPVAAFPDSTLVRTAISWFVESFADGGTPIALAVSQVPFNLTQIDVPGEPQNYLEYQFTTGGANLGPNSYLKIVARLAPNVLNGKYAVYSFWMNSDVLGRLMVMEVRRNYGTGGSPSPDDIFPVNEPLILTAVGWQRYALTMPLLPINDGAGHVRSFGTDNNGYLEVALYFQRGSASPLPVGGIISPASNVIQIAQPQFEAGNTPTDWVDGDPLTSQFSPTGDIRVWDPNASEYRTLTAPDGAATFSDPSP